jgi:hypothetical protein
MSLGFAVGALVLAVATPAFAEATVIPEPASLALLGTAAAALGLRAYRNRNR